MKRRLVPPLLLASLLATATFAASAQTAAAVDATASAPPQASSEVGVNTQAKAASDASANTGLAADTKPQAQRNCVQYTGSRIVPRYNTTRSARARDDKAVPRCVIANGRTYSRDDIERTGEVDIADALRKLDPSIH